MSPLFISFALIKEEAQVEFRVAFSEDNCQFIILISSLSSLVSFKSDLRPRFNFGTLNSIDKSLIFSRYLYQTDN
jgi:hypothetical protein